MCVDAARRSAPKILAAAGIGALLLAASVQLGVGVHRHAAASPASGVGSKQGGGMVARLPVIDSDIIRWRIP